MQAMAQQRAGGGGRGGGGGAGRYQEPYEKLIQPTQVWGRACGTEPWFRCCASARPLLRLPFPLGQQLSASLVERALGHTCAAHAGVCGDTQPGHFVEQAAPASLCPRPPQLLRELEACGLGADQVDPLWEAYQVWLNV